MSPSLTSNTSNIGNNVVVVSNVARVRNKEIFAYLQNNYVTNI